MMQAGVLGAGARASAGFVLWWVLSSVAIDDDLVASGAVGTLGSIAGWTYVFDREPLSADGASVSALNGGSQTLRIDAGWLHSTDVYLVLGSASGTSPGLSVGGGWVLPLNSDAYLDHTLANPDSAPLTGSLGVLSSAGSAVASFTLPSSSDPGLVGLVAHHAFLTLGTSGPTVTLASNSQPVIVGP